MTLLAFAIGVVAGTAIGLALGAKWRNDLRSELEAARQRLMAYNASDTRADLAEVGPVTGQTKTVAQYDQATERQCNNCGKPAEFAWLAGHAGLPDEDARLVPFAACNFCVSLWFEDGLPDWVIRLNDVGEVMEQVTAGGDVDEALVVLNEYLGPDGLCHWRCDTPIDVLDDDSRWCSTCEEFIDHDTADDDESDVRSLPAPRMSD